MNLHVWWDEPADGPFNMAADELLAVEAASRGAMCVRIYGWTDTTVSLGAFQRIGEARDERAIVGVPLVRRPSGGGAIVHGSDLTYAAAVPRAHPLGDSPQRLYDAFHDAMKRTLAACGVEVFLWGHDRGDAASSAPGSAFFCFDRRSPGDVVMADPATGTGRGHKVMGSAQRRLAATVVQHGSLLLRRNEGVHGAAAHPGLEDLAPGRVAGGSVRGLAERWLEHVAAACGLVLQEDAGSAEVERTIQGLARRFEDSRWTERR